MASTSSFERSTIGKLLTAIRRVLRHLRLHVGVSKESRDTDGEQHQRKRSEAPSDDTTPIRSLFRHIIHCL